MVTERSDVTTTTTIKPDDTRHSVLTPDSRYRYQLAINSDGEVTTNLFTVWEWPEDGSFGWRTVTMIMVDESGYGPKMVGGEDGATPIRALVQAYMRAAGHIWAARVGGLWAEPEGK
jgi:hypothetical protein